MNEPNAPLAASRRKAILRALASSGSVRITALTDELGVTAVTLRRDLKLMEAEGLLLRVHGGAVPPEGGIVADAGERRTTISTVGVLVPSLSYYWPGVVRGIEERASSNGARVLVRGTSYELQDERPVLQRMVEREGADAFIVAPNTDTPHAGDVVEWLHDTGLPFVLAERDATMPVDSMPVESVTTDHALGAAMAAHHLAELGHRRLGLITTQDSPTSRKIVSGWRPGCASANVTATEHVVADHRSPEFGASAARILDRLKDEGVTGVLIHPDAVALAIVDLALARGLSIPGDLSVIAYDDEIARLGSPALTAVHPPRFELGRTAYDLLLGRLADPDRAAHRVLLSPSINLRASAAAPGTPS